MPYQLLIRKESEDNLAELFARGVRQDIAQLPVEFCGNKVDGRLPATLHFRLEEQPHGGAGMRFLPGCGQVLSNGETYSCDGVMPLHNGDRIAIDGWQIRFYQLHGRPGVSWQANAMSTLACVGVALALAIQLFTLLVWPWILTQTDSWRKEREVQEITIKMDSMRRKLSRVEAKDPVVEAWVGAVREELGDRARYFRENAKKLNSAERRAMSENLLQLEATLAKVVEHQKNVEDAPAELDLEPAIRKILSDGY